MKLLITWLIVCLVSRSQGKPTKVTVSLYFYNYWLSKDAHLLVHAFSDRRGTISHASIPFHPGLHVFVRYETSLTLPDLHDC